MAIIRMSVKESSILTQGQYALIHCVQIFFVNEKKKRLNGTKNDCIKRESNPRRVDLIRKVDWQRPRLPLPH